MWVVLAGSSQKIAMFFIRDAHINFFIRFHYLVNSKILTGLHYRAWTKYLIFYFSLGKTLRFHQFSIDYPLKNFKCKVTLTEVQHLRWSVFIRIVGG